MIEHAKFTYSPLEKAFENKQKQSKSTERINRSNQRSRKKQGEAL